jgi:hypothetical protein
MNRALLGFALCLSLIGCSATTRGTLNRMGLSPHPIGTTADARTEIDNVADKFVGLKEKTDTACANPLAPKDICLKIRLAWTGLTAVKRTLDQALYQWAKAGGNRNSEARQVFRAKWDEAEADATAKIEMLLGLEDSVPGADPLSDLEPAVPIQ